MSRLHFVGSLPYGLYKRLLQCSSVHVYLTRPFVLSWSAIEAMSCGCCLVASDTEPVREVMVDGENALLADFHDSGALASRIAEALDDADLRARICEGARTTAVERYSLKTLLPKHIELLVDTARAGNSL